MDDQEFLHAFKNATLPPSDFDHKAHLRLAYICLKQLGTEKAVNSVSDQIRNYTKKWGATDKYHETLTHAAVYVMAHFMSIRPIDEFDQLVDHFPRLQSNFSELISQHYSSALLSLPKAKEEFIEPDLLPFKF